MARTDSLINRGFIGMGSKKNYRNAKTVFYLRCSLDTVHLSPERDIHQDNIRAQRSGFFDCLRSVIDNKRRVVPNILKAVLEIGSGNEFILNDKDRCRSTS